MSKETIFGTKTITPIDAEIIEQIRTPAAERSFTFPAISLCCGDTRLVRYSNAVLKHSAAVTNPIAKSSKIHSTEVILKKNRWRKCRLVFYYCIDYFVGYCFAKHHSKELLIAIVGMMFSALLRVTAILATSNFLITHLYGI